MGHRLPRGDQHGVDPCCKRHTATPDVADSHAPDKGRGCSPEGVRADSITFGSAVGAITHVSMVLPS